MRNVLLIGLLYGGLGCDTSTTPHMVDYGDTQQVGQWQISGTAGTNGSTTPLAGGTAGTNQIMPTAGTGAEAGIGSSASGSGGIGGIGAAGDGSIPQAGMGAAGDGSAAGSGSVGVGDPTSLTFDVTTKSQNGKYAPRNVGAIWIATASGQFVKTLEVWAFVRAGHLDKWNAETGGNRVDAVSSATLSNHKTHHVTWNLKDVNGNRVPAGTYEVVVEVTDRNGAGQFATVSFDIGAAPTTISPPDEAYYQSMQVALQ